MILTTLHTDDSRPFAKTCNADGTWQGYPKTTFHSHESIEVSTLAEVFEALRAAGQAGSAFVQGQVCVDEPVIRRLTRDRPDAQATIKSGDLELGAFDVDGLTLPEGVDLSDACALGDLAASYLPGSFQKASRLVQFTASHGIKGVRLRLWFWLTTPVSAEACKLLCHEANKQLGKAVFDQLIFNAAQLHYLSDPVFADVTMNPVAERWFLIEREAEQVDWIPTATAKRVRGLLPGKTKVATTLNLKALARGEGLAEGTHQALMDAARQQLALGVAPDAVAQAVKLAVAEGIEAGDLDDARKADLLDRVVYGNEVDSVVDWLHGQREVEAATEIKLKGQWRDDLVALARIPDGDARVAYALEVFRRYERRFPKKLSAENYARIIAEHAGFDADATATLIEAAQQRGAARAEAARTLHAAEGIEAAYNRNREARARAEANREQFKKLGGRLPANDGPYTEIPEIAPGSIELVEVDSNEAARDLALKTDADVVVVQAAHGTGKTRIVLKGCLEAQSDRTRAVVVSHRRSLVSDHCKVLGLVDYRNVTGHVKLTPMRLGVCNDSLARFPLGMDKVPLLLLIDEWTQVVRGMHLPGVMDQPLKVQGKLRSAMARAAKTILTDADLNADSLAFIAAEANKTLVIRVKTPVIPLRTVILSGCEKGENLLALIKKGLISGERVLVAAESQQFIQDVEKVCQELGLAPNEYACVTSENVEEHRELLADINSHVGRLRVLAYSPVISSGVSLVVKHFTKHYAANYGVLTPADFRQMIRRDRTAEAFHLAFLSELDQTMETLVTDLNDIQERVTAALDAEHRHGRLPGLWTTAEIHRSMFTQTENLQRLDGQNQLVAMMAELGEVSYMDVAADDDAAAEMKALSAERKAAELQAVVDAPVIGDDRFDRLEKLKQDGALARVDLPAFKQALIRHGLVLGEVAPTLEQVELWDDGKLVPKLRALELVVCDTDELNARRMADENRLLADQEHAAWRREAYQTLLGPDLLRIIEAGGNGDWRLTPSRAAEMWDFAASHAQALRGVGVNVPKTKPQRCGGWAKGVLQAIGVVFGDYEQVGGGAREVVYPLDSQALVARLGYVRDRLGIRAERRGAEIGSPAYMKSMEGAQDPSTIKIAPRTAPCPPQVSSGRRGKSSAAK